MVSTSTRVRAASSGISSRLPPRMNVQQEHVGRRVADHRGRSSELRPSSRPPPGRAPIRAASGARPRPPRDRRPVRRSPPGASPRHEDDNAEWRPGRAHLGYGGSGIHRDQICGRGGIAKRPPPADARPWTRTEEDPWRKRLPAGAHALLHLPRGRGRGRRGDRVRRGRGRAGPAVDCRWLRPGTERLLRRPAGAGARRAATADRTAAVAGERPLVRRQAVGPVR